MKIREIITTTVMILAIIAVSTTAASALSCSDGDICVNQSGWWRDGGVFNASTTPIQVAVNSATAGETICVAAGSYTENVDIATPHLTLTGEGAGVVTVNAASSLDHVFEVTADYVNISGFNATGASESRKAGICLDSADHCNISENTASNSYYGIYLYPSSNNALASNNASSNSYYGIALISSRNNTLTGNNCSNSYYGILLHYSSNDNTLANNTANSNNIYGISLSHSSNYNMLTGNTASSNNDEGISLSSSSNNMLTGNNCSNNDEGIRMYSSSGNTLTGNTASSNHGRGIYLYSSSNDSLIYNNYFNNTNNAYDDGNNHWNITKTTGTNIIGGSYLGGNYWSDYAGDDSDNDGLGDSPLPYNSSDDIQNGGDYQPLVPCADTTPPVITITTPVPYGIYTVGMELNFSATDDESGVATIVGNLTNTSEVSQNVSSSFAPPVGVYTLVVTATDNAGNTNDSDPVFFVVCDPDGGRATGGDRFCPDDDSTLPGGKANFGFTAEYKKGVSTGKLNFRHKDADIRLKSTSIDWLVISSVSAQFQGTGTINGEGLYTFRVNAKDNGKHGAGSDHFDIKIWNGTNTEDDPYHLAKNTISGGDIKVHMK